MFSLRRSVFRSLKPGSVYVPPAVLQQQRVRAFQTASVFTSSHSPLAVERAQETQKWNFLEQQRRMYGNEGEDTGASFTSGSALASESAGQQSGSEEGGIFQNHRDLNGQPLTPTKTIYVGNISYGIRAEDLAREFAEFGQVLNTKIIYDPRGLSKGFGYVEFENTEASGAAVGKMHGLHVDGRRITVQYVAKPETSTTQDNAPSRTLFIGNLAFEITDKDLNDLFKDIRNCTDVRVAIDRRTGQPRGFAHADFTDINSAQTARGVLEGREFFGRKLKLDYSSSNSGKNQRSFMRN